MENRKSTIDNLEVRKAHSLKSHSIIALNLQTIDDVEQVIRQCEALKGQMQGGSSSLKLSDNKITLASKPIKI